MFATEIMLVTGIMIRNRNNACGWLKKAL